MAAIAAAVASGAPADARGDVPGAPEGSSTSALRIEEVNTRVTSFDQYGHGYQSQAGPVLGPGSERATIFEAQAEVVMSQGPRLTHRLWIPVDIVTAASPNSIAPPDVVSGPSRHVESVSLGWTTTYAASRRLGIWARDEIHWEEPFNSWSSSLGFRHSFANEATVVSGVATQLFDYFDHRDIHGSFLGTVTRTGTTASVGVTRILTPTTVVNLNYGFTVLRGTLGNTWNSVPIADGTRGEELLPKERVRHAVVGRASQWLPWNGALRVYGRFYADDWGIVAESIEGELAQRLSPELYVAAYYRFHNQTGTSFFTTLAPVDWSERVADSDLAPLQSSTVGGKVVVDLPRFGGARRVHLDLAVERYLRTNDLQMTMVSFGTGFRF